MNIQKKRVIVQGILKWVKEGHLREFPWRKEKRIWALGLAEILLTRTPAKRVLPVFEELVKRYPSPLDLSKAELRQLTDILKPLGLQKKKAVQIRALASIFSKNIPLEIIWKEIKEVPGMGKYSYNAFLLFGLGIVVPIVDGNIGRVYARYFGVNWKGKAVSDKNAWELARELTPNNAEDAKLYSYGLIDFANQICKKKPLHNLCPISLNCSFFNITLQKPH